MSDTLQSIESMSFEQALKELEVIVKNLETGDVALDSAISSYERGAKLKQHCMTKLSDAKTRIEKINVGSDGVATTQPLDS